MLSFHEMERKFGTAAAYHCLLEIEKVARIPTETVMGIDPEIRLRNACRAQDDMPHPEQVA
jgi:tRNA A37 threonylcarbamoyladenosine synthetase subunit TsaC/SUA5/YrdC